MVSSSTGLFSLCIAILASAQLSYSACWIWRCCYTITVCSLVSEWNVCSLVSCMNSVVSDCIFLARPFWLSGIVPCFTNCIQSKYYCVLLSCKPAGVKVRNGHFWWTACFSRKGGKCICSDQIVAVCMVKWYRIIHGHFCTWISEIDLNADCNLRWNNFKKQF